MKLTKSNQIKFILNPILIGMLGMSVQAQAKTDVDDNGYAMVVTANRSAQSISDIAATVLVVEGEQIAEQVKSGVDFKAALANLIPSLDVGSQSRSNAGQNMRGRTALVMIDGISLNSSRSISRQFDAINPFNIERIEVISGASAMYGGGSTGGIINIITKKGSSEELGIHGETWIGAKSGFNKREDIQYQVAQSISKTTEKMDARLAISYDQAEGRYDADGDMILHDFAQTPSQFVSQLDILGNVGFDISDTKRLELMAQFYDSGQDSDYGIDYGPSYSYLFDPSRELEMVEGYDLDDQARTKRIMLAANYSDSHFFNQTLNVQLYYREESLRFNPAPNGAFTNVSASEQETSVIGTKVVLTAQPIDQLKLVYGADLEFEQFEATQSYYNIGTAAASNGLVYDPIGDAGRYPDIDTTSIAAFLQAEYELNDSWNLHGGIRYQYTNIKVSDFVDSEQQYAGLIGDTTNYDAIEGGSNDYSNTLLNAGILYKINEEQQVWLNLSQGFEIPDSAKYYGQGTYNADGSVANSVNVSDSPLEGVKTNAVELGWRLNQESLSTQLAAYYSISDKEIELQDDFSIDVIDNDVRIYGLEGQLDYALTNALSVGGNFQYIVSESKTDGKWQDLSVTTASPSKATAYINWATNITNTRLQTTQLFDYEDANDEEIDGYNTVDLLTSVRLPVGSMQLGVTNLFNEDYETLWSQRADVFYGLTNLTDFKGQGRTYSVNYNVKF
ncbi:TonB-dependent receptor [Psychromonas arctica]|uniref:TonB-dependent receptor n=1 Tax=Psychromonas arctica TaxID=168275 RepID=A0ABU9HDX5_9GAMM